MARTKGNNKHNTQPTQSQVKEWYKGARDSETKRKRRQYFEGTYTVGPKGARTYSKEAKGFNILYEKKIRRKELQQSQLNWSSILKFFDYPGLTTQDIINAYKTPNFSAFCIDIEKKKLLLSGENEEFLDDDDDDDDDKEDITFTEPNGFPQDVINNVPPVSRYEVQQPIIQPNVYSENSDKIKSSDLSTAKKKIIMSPAKRTTPSKKRGRVKRKIKHYSMFNTKDNKGYVSWAKRSNIGFKRKDQTVIQTFIPPPESFFNAAFKSKVLERFKFDRNKIMRKHLEQELSISKLKNASHITPQKNNESENVEELTLLKLNEDKEEEQSKEELSSSDVFGNVLPFEKLKKENVVKYEDSDYVLVAFEFPVIKEESDDGEDDLIM